MRGRVLGTYIDNKITGPYTSLNCRLTLLKSSVRISTLPGDNGYARGGADEGREAAIGEAGGDADHVLLGDADVDEAIGKFLLEGDEIARADAVIADRDDTLVGARKLDQSLGEGLPAIERFDLRGCQHHCDLHSLEADRSVASILRN